MQIKLHVIKILFVNSSPQNLIYSKMKLGIKAWSSETLLDFLHLNIFLKDNKEKHFKEINVSKATDAINGKFRTRYKLVLNNQICFLKSKPYSLFFLVKKP